MKKSLIVSEKNTPLHNMKKYLISFFLVLCFAPMWAWNSPVTIPDVGNARLRIVGQNAENYLENIAASNSSCTTQAQFEAKTYKMANVFIALQADIVAICEVERNDQILGYIVNAMNDLSGGNVYTYITDGLYSHADAGEYQSLKSGFIYRKSAVTPYGSNITPYTSGAEYKARLRIQAFQENSTNEIFVLSMNHFKAKDSSADAGEGTRLQNVSQLLSKLESLNTDPDILIMGDLNAYMGEQPIENLENAGYEEQMLRFDPDAYTYIYHGSEGMLDHSMANATMAAQITGAYAYHINTAGGYNYRYSDHDAVLVGLRLGNNSGEGIDNIEATTTARKVLRNGQLFIELDGQIFTITGTKVQ